MVPVIWGIAFLGISAVAILTYKRGNIWGLTSFIATLVGWVVVAIMLSSREVLSSAMLGSLLGLPVVIAAQVARRRKNSRPEHPIRMRTKQ